MIETTVDTAHFAVLDAADPLDHCRWQRVWNDWPAREPFAHPEYVNAFLEPGQKALCSVQHSPAGIVLMPMIVRPVKAEDHGGLMDAVTPYGYGGAFAWGDADVEGFWDDMDAWARDNRVVSLFARLSLLTDSIIPFRGEAAYVMDNVVRTLELHEDQILSGYEHKVRKNIKKALRSGVTVEWDFDGSRLDEFYEIYLRTMQRRHASSGYYFPLSFFENLVRDCAGSVGFAHSLVGGKMISTEMILIGADTVYSFLGGTDEAFFELRPNDLLKHAIISWSREQGKRQFVIGGGYKPNDGIFRYKLSFAPDDGIRPFFVGRRIFDQGAYDRLVSERSAHEPGWSPEANYFPAYRAPAATT